MIAPYYQDDRVFLYHGDYAEILPQLENESVDLVLTDPPFGIGYQNNYTKTKFDVLKNDTKDFSYETLIRETYRILVNNTCCFIYTGWSNIGDNFLYLKQNGFKIKEPLIIQKRASGTTDLYGSFQSNVDWVLFAHKGRFTFRKSRLVRNVKAGYIRDSSRKPVPEFKTRFPNCWFGEDYPLSTENPKRVKHFYHPTVKTIQCMEWLIQISTGNDALVVDPFMGTGTTVIAAYNLNRRAVGIEIEEQFCEVAALRLERAKREKEKA